MTTTVWLVIDDEPHDDGETPDNGIVIAGAMDEADARDQAEREELDPLRNVIALEVLDPGERYPEDMRSEAERENDRNWHDYYVTVRESQTYKVRASDENTAEALVLENRLATDSMPEITGIDVERSRRPFVWSEIDWSEIDWNEERDGDEL